MSEDSQQISFDLTYTPRHPQAPMFDGETYSKQFDCERLTGLMRAVYDLMKDGEWRTAAEIKDIIQRGSEGGIGARMRDLRKAKWGSHDVPSRRRGDEKNGLYEYRMVL